MKFLKRKWVILLLVPILIFSILFLLRYPILRAIGNYLVSEDPLTEVQAIFVLSGSAYSRGTEASEIYKQGFSKKVIFTGEELSIPGNKTLCIDSISTSELTQQFAISAADFQERLTRGGVVYVGDYDNACVAAPASACS